jgi:hypothetical protein
MSSMQVKMYMYIYVYICIHIYAYIYEYICEYVYIHVYTYFICMHIFISDILIHMQVNIFHWNSNIYFIRHLDSLYL